MKKLLILGLALVFVLGFAVAAYAVPGIPSGGIGEGGYLTPTAGVNPHGLYSTTTNKCKTCHAVHGATAGGEALLRSTKSNACVFCHVSATFAIKHPYGTDPVLYTTDYENNHAATHFTLGQPAYNGCVSCHSVHGANTFSSAADGISFGDILKVNPGGTITTAGTGSIAADAADLDTFCRDCHDGTTNGTTGNSCDGSVCHATQMMVSKFATRNQVSHIQTTTLTNATGQQVAFTAAPNCRSCHKGAAVYAEANSFPHITSGADFLMDGHTSTSPLDRVCLDCHQSGGSGVGLTF